uniref:Integrase catalytic domain-containing protein n=1 Tax=Caenorhabditis japonica TaxID=281687 RepID=A0A8R1I1S8_CAEJA
MICWFSKIVISVPLPDATCETTSRAILDELVLKFGTPNQIVSDNGPAFTAAAFKQFCELLEVSHHRAIPHHSRGNGATERTFRTFHSVIAKHVNNTHTDWDSVLQFATFCYNTTVHKTTGETPFFLVFGRDPTLTIDRIIDPAPKAGKADIPLFRESLTTVLQEAWEEAAKRSRQAQEEYQKTANKGAKGSGIRPGDRVMYRDYSNHKGHSRKLTLPWTGDYRVITVNHPLATIREVKNRGKPDRTVHLDQIKKFWAAEDGDARSISSQSDAEEPAEVSDVETSNTIHTPVTPDDVGSTKSRNSAVG